MDETEDESRSTLVATALGCAVVTGLASAAPAALRIRASGLHEGLFTTWIALGAVALLPSLLFVFAFRSLRREFARSAENGAVRIGTLALALATATSLNVLIGAFLRKTTHHAGLAGATYGVMVAATLVASYLIARRIGQYALHEASMQKVFALFGVFSLAAIVCLAFLRLSRSVGTTLPAPYASGLLDALLIVLVSYLLSHTALRAQSVLRLVGPPLALVTLGIGIYALRGIVLPEAAPLHAVLLRLLVH